MDKRRLNLLKPTTILINVGRGAIVDQGALVEILKVHKIRGAALDVFDEEPLAREPSNAIVELANLQNVLATPHVAFNTVEAKDKLGEEILANLRACIAGRPIHVVR